MALIKVLIENEAGSNKKNLYNEETLEHMKTVTVSREYPYPYGFILNTTSGDGMNLDCFVLTEKKLKSGDLVECEPIGVLLQREDDEEDNNILAVLKDETIEINENILQTLKSFIEHVFDHIEGKKIEVGDFLGKEAAIELIRECTDKGNNK